MPMSQVSHHHYPTHNPPGDSPLRFSQLRSWQQTDVVLKKVVNEETGLAMLCLNDDTTVHQAPLVKERLEAWIERKWPSVVPWER